jgi:hypothetical protein
MIDSAPVVQKSPAEAGPRLGRRDCRANLRAKWMSDFDVSTLSWRSGRWAIAWTISSSRSKRLWLALALRPVAALGQDEEPGSTAVTLEAEEEEQKEMTVGSAMRVRTWITRKSC